jgi:hypothetical protein
MEQLSIFNSAQSLKLPAGTDGTTCPNTFTRQESADLMQKLKAYHPMETGNHPDVR